MSSSRSPHPRYRIYTTAASYTLPLRAVPSSPRGAEEARSRLEHEICRRFEVAAALCVPSARTGLYLGLRELIQPGQTVVMSPLTIVDVVNMVLLAGGIPVFADILRHSCALDPERAESLIDLHTGALLVTHLHGGTAGARVFQDICRRRGIPLIEDGAQAFGATEAGRRLGTFGDLGVYSFGFYKNVNAWRGGMLVSHDSGLIERLRRRTNEWPILPHRRLLALALKGLMTDLATWPPLFGAVTYRAIRYATLRDVAAVTRSLDPEYGARRLGSLPADYRERMGTTQVLLALGQLDRVDSDSAARIAIAARYHEALAGFEALITPRDHEGLSHIYTYYPVQHQERAAVLRHAFGRGRDLAPQHLRNCADLPEFAELYRDCPNARAAALELILLPTYPRYPWPEVERNIDALREFLSGNHPDEPHGTREKLPCTK